jgi:hypothetical protein
MRAALLGICLVVTFAAGDALAQPREVRAQIAEDRKDCRDTGYSARTHKGYVRNADFNGDGKPDYILDNDKLDCGTVKCGSAGCTITIFVSAGQGYRLSFDDNVRSWKIVRRGRRTVIEANFHGSYCGRAGSYECRKTISWNGLTMSAQ